MSHSRPGSTGDCLEERRRGLSHTCPQWLELGEGGRGEQ